VSQDALFYEPHSSCALGHGYDMSRDDSSSDEYPPSAPLHIHTRRLLRAHLSVTALWIGVVKLRFESSACRSIGGNACQAGL
jgi:hypothetical protein